MSTLSVVPLNITMTITNSSSIIFTILFGICLSLIALTTALGNIVVLLAFYCDKKLRTINGKYIFENEIFRFMFFFKKIISY